MKGDKIEKLSRTESMARATARAGKGLLEFYCKLESKATPFYQLLKKGGNIKNEGKKR